jgi:chromosomal replication initiation ATPase DnaA
MTFYKKYTKMSLKSIGQEFRGEKPGKVKDHTTVIHSIRTVKDLCDTDPMFSKEVKYIECMFI